MRTFRQVPIAWSSLRDRRMGWDVFIFSSAFPWQTMMRIGMSTLSPPRFPLLDPVFFRVGLGRVSAPWLSANCPVPAGCIGVVCRTPEEWYQIKYLPTLQRVLLTAHKKIREVSDDLLAQQPQSRHTDLPSSTIYQVWPSLRNVSLVSLKFQFGIQPGDTETPPLATQSSGYSAFTRTFSLIPSMRSQIIVNYVHFLPSNMP
jgi:hypothetical protein